MTTYVVVHALNGHHAEAYERANELCQMVNRRAAIALFADDERRVREALDELADSQLQRILKISIVAK